MDRAVRLGLVAMTAVALVFGGPSVRASEASDVEARAIVGQALEASRSDLPPDSSWIGELRRLGPSSVEAILDSLRSSAPGGADEAFLAQTLGRLGGELVLSHVRQQAPPSDAAGARALLLAIGATGGASELTLALDIAGPTPPIELEACLAELLARAPADLPRAQSAALTRPLPVANAIVAAITRLASPAALDALVALLQGDPAGLRTTLLSRIGTLAARRPFDVNAQHRAVTRAYLQADRFQDRREAALLAGRMRDAEAVPQLIDFLDDELLGKTSAWALRQITAQDFPTPDRWRVWLIDEEAWMQGTAPILLEQLNSRAVVQVRAALKEIGSHPYYRQRLTPSVQTLLSHPVAEVCIEACQALETLGSSGAIDPLLSILINGDPQVVHAATEALTTITGLRPSAEEPAWRAALGR